MTRINSLEAALKKSVLILNFWNFLYKYQIAASIKSSYLIKNLSKMSNEF
jgi:hypothetical protein